MANGIAECNHHTTLTQEVLRIITDSHQDIGETTLVQC